MEEEEELNKLAFQLPPSFYTKVRVFLFPRKIKTKHKKLRYDFKYGFFPVQYFLSSILVLVLFCSIFLAH